MESAKRVTEVAAVFALFFSLTPGLGKICLAQVSDTDPLQTAGDPPFDYLAPYYADASTGLIQPVISPPLPDANSQDWFYLNVPGFNQAQGRSDFLEASRAFYSQLNFNTKTQLHGAPYYYMSSWRNLFHPPIKALTQPLTTYDQRVTPMDPSQENPAYFDPIFQQTLDRQSGTELTAGNQLQLLPNDTSFVQKVRMIREAKHYFFGIVMVYFCDQSTELLLDEMILKKQQGVDVRIMVDGLLGHTVVGVCLAKMKKAGIPVVEFTPFFNSNSFVSIMHDKFWIRDGEEAIIGGQNMHENSNYSTGFDGRTRDTDVWIKTGPAVTDLVREYARLWQKHSKGSTNSSMTPYATWASQQAAAERSAGNRGPANYATWLNNPQTRDQGLCRAIVQDGGAVYEPIAPVVSSLIASARTRIEFSSPMVSYKLNGQDATHWPEKLAAQLKAKASLEGVPVDALSNGLEGGAGEFTYVLERIQSVLTDGNIPILPVILQALDNWQNFEGGKSNRTELLDLAKTPGIRTWTYLEFIHAKTWIFDRLVTSIGSMNFDIYSTERSNEATLVCMDTTLAQQLENQFVMDLSNSVPVVSANGL